MQNEPQLSADMEKRFDEELGILNLTHIPIRVKKNGEVLQNAGGYVKHFLATSLEEQKAETLEDFVNELLKASNVDIDQESKNHIVQIYQSILNGKDK